MRKPITTIGLLSLLAAAPASGQRPHDPHTPHGLTHGRQWARHLVVPQAQAFAMHEHAVAVILTGVEAQVSIVDGVASTTLEVELTNNSHRQEEAELLLPVPLGAAVSGFDFLGEGAEPSARVLPLEEAKSTYASIVRRLKDPALLEFAEAGLLRSSVFPVPARGMQKVKVRYEHVLPELNGRWDYVLPRSENLVGQVPWTVAIEVRSARAMADVYSPSHDLVIDQRTPRQWKLRTRPNVTPEAGPLRLAILHGGGPVATTLFTCADRDGKGGWFLLLAGIGQRAQDAPDVMREVTVVLDRSGSMGGEKFQQAKEAARQVLEGLRPGESMHLIDYSDTVERCSSSPMIKGPKTMALLRRYLDGLHSGGGTDLDGALQAALTPDPGAGFLPIVLFLTDGLPTAGVTDEASIRRRAEQANVHGRRLFTFGLGNDVNAPLLDVLASESRAVSTYVRPDEDVEVAVGQVYQRLSGPVVTDLAFEVQDLDGGENTRLVRDVYPRVLPDLFENDRLVLLGRYTDQAPARLQLKGMRGERATSWDLEFDFAWAQPRNDFVRRLWAMRRIGALEDELRQAGADPRQLAHLQQDPRFKEIVGELLELSALHGVLSDSTAFLALEGTDLGSTETLMAQVEEQAKVNPTRRSDQSGVALAQNVATQQRQSWVNGANVLMDEQGQTYANPTVQNRGGRTYFQRGSRWIDGRMALNGAGAERAPDRVITFGTAEYDEFVARWVREGRSRELALSGEILLQDGEQTVLLKPASQEIAGEVE